RLGPGAEHLGPGPQPLDDLLGGGHADVRGQQRVLDLLPGFLVQVLPGQQGQQPASGSSRDSRDSGPRPRVDGARDSRERSRTIRPAAASGTSIPGPVVSTRVPSPGLAPASGSAPGLASGSVSTAVSAASVSAPSGGTAFSGAGGNLVPRRRGTTRPAIAITSTITIATARITHSIPRVSQLLRPATRPAPPARGSDEARRGQLAAEPPPSIRSGTAALRS